MLGGGTGQVVVGGQVEGGAQRVQLASHSCRHGQLLEGKLKEARHQVSEQLGFEIDGLLPVKVSASRWA